MGLTTAERRLNTAIGFDEDITNLIKDTTGRSLRRLRAVAGPTTDVVRYEDTAGLSVEVSREESMSLLNELQPQLLPRGYRAFWSEIFRRNGGSLSDELAVVKGADDMEIIRLRCTNGSNYGVETEDIILRLQSWRSRCQFQVAGSSGSWIAVIFATLPADLCMFAEEVYEFCPDTVVQGVGLKREADSPEDFKAARELCPNLSETMQRKLDEEKSRFQAMDIPAEFRAMLEPGGSGFTTTTDMGIRLLALELQRSKQLFLWWD